MGTAADAVLLLGLFSGMAAAVGGGVIATVYTVFKVQEIKARRRTR